MVRQDLAESFSHCFPFYSVLKITPGTIAFLMFSVEVRTLDLACIQWTGSLDEVSYQTSDVRASLLPNAWHASGSHWEAFCCRLLA